MLESFLFGFLLFNFLNLYVLFTGDVYDSTDRCMVTVRLRMRFIHNEVSSNRFSGGLESNLSGSLLDIVVSLFGGFLGLAHFFSDLIFITEAFFMEHVTYFFAKEELVEFLAFNSDTAKNIIKIDTSS